MGHDDGVVQPQCCMSLSLCKIQRKRYAPVRQSDINFDNKTCAGIIFTSKARGHPPYFIKLEEGMKHRVTLFALVAVLALGLSGCGGKEREELRQKVTNLEQQLAKATSQLAEKEASMASMETSLKEAQDEVAKVKVERDKLKAEVARLKKKTGTVTKKK